MSTVRHIAALLGSAWVVAFGAESPVPIDRHALVTRHNVTWNDVNGQVPLGNGEFCFNADGTGLQTFGGNTMAHWAWHSFPLPAGVTQERIPSTGTFQRGRNAGPDVVPIEDAEIGRWMRDNPHSLSLGRLRLVKAKGAVLTVEEIKGLTRTLDLWSGTQTSTFIVNGEPVRVVTCVHPELDQVAVLVESPLLARGEIEVALDFSYPAVRRNVPWIGDFDRTEGNKTTLSRPDGHRAEFLREIDAFTYHATLTWAGGCNLEAPAAPGEHAWRLVGTPGASGIEFACAFSVAPSPPSLAGFAATQAASISHWERFWTTGGAIDLSGSSDPRWPELERRIVLSQYLTAVQSAGSQPPAEIGLMGMDSWAGHFHMEMVWWHLAHFALWDRWAMADRALESYRRLIPVARALAEQLGYRGLMWPKGVGPEGRSAPWAGNLALLWKEPHPIFFAELDYRLHPTRETLEKWAAIVQGTAEYMADYPTRDEQTGVYHLNPVMPPSEQGLTVDTVFDLAYWRWGLEQAQVWRVRMGLAREPRWDEVRIHLAPLPVEEGFYVHSAAWHDTYTKRAWEHPDPIGVYGMLPPEDGVDRETAHRTLLKIWSTWDWKRCWGWDFPWMAMAAARLGEPKLAVDALLKDAGVKNNYDPRGVCTGGPCPYLPGNGGLLYAVAMMSAGWDGAPARHAPGFPDDGTWVVHWEGLKPAP